MADDARTSVPEPELAGGLLRGRARFHLSYRTLVRLYGLLADEELADQLPAAILSFAGDVAWFLRLRSSDDEHLLPRLAADCLDVAYWSAISPTGSDHPTLIAVPLGIEAGARHGPRALGVPVAITAVATAARRLRGRSTPLMFLFWPTAAVLAGIATARNSRRQDDATIAEQAVRSDARAGSAYVAGQNAVAMGADSVVDLLTRTEPLIRVLEEELGSEVEARSGTAWALSAWKSELATSSAGRAAYLGTLLTRWERSRSVHDLKGDVVLDLPEGAGTTLISAPQAEWLTARLDRLGLQGRQTVAVPDSVVPGARFTLAVGHHLLEVPADPEPPVRSYEHAPVLLALGAVWSAVAARPGNEEAGWAVLPGVIGSLGLAGWAHLRIRRREPAVDARLLTALVGVAALHGAVVAVHQAHSHDERGLPLFPQLGGPVTSLVLLAAQRLPRRIDAQLARTLTVVAATTIPGFLVARARGPVSPRAIAVASLNLWAWWACMWGADDDLEHHRRVLVDRSSDAAGRRERAARVAGRDKVRSLVSSAYLDSRQRVQALGDAARGDLPPQLESLRDEVLARLATAGEMLDDLGRTDGAAASDRGADGG